MVSDVKSTNMARKKPNVPHIWLFFRYFNGAEKKSNLMVAGGAKCAAHLAFASLVSPTFPGAGHLSFLIVKAQTTPDPQTKSAADLAFASLVSPTFPGAGHLSFSNKSPRKPQTPKLISWEIALRLSLVSPIFPGAYQKTKNPNPDFVPDCQKNRLVLCPRAC